MEIRRGTVPTVEFYLPSPDTTVTGATYALNDGEPVTLTVSPPAEGKVTTTLPYQPNDAEVKVNWTFTIGGQTYTESETYQVVTPLLSDVEIGKIIETSDPEEIASVEQAVRHIIAAHTGQNFGKYVGPISVTGSGDTNLRLPRRLISYITVNGSNYFNQLLALRGGGWFLQSKHVYTPSVRADFEGWHYNNTYPITAPYSRALSTFVKHQEYVIDGVWGWEEVPQPVKEAAKLLVNDYACADSMYRDRFLTSMTAADWRIQFHEGAFSNTGNVRANQLLSEYVLRRGWVVV